eukprot:Gb_39452 [translate_table: standard]
MVQAFLKTMNVVWDSGHIPANSKSTILVSIPKKGDLILHDNYCMVSLIPVLLKVLTSVIIKWIDLMLEERVLHEEPSFDEEVKSGKSFGKASEIIRNLYSSTTMRVRYENLVSSVVSIQRGVRQGCPMSRTLFNIFINHIVDDLKGMGVEMLRKMHWWAQKWGMACGIDEWKAMVVFGDEDALRVEELLIGEDGIGVCDSYKYLGIEVDYKLSIERIIKERATAGRKALFGLRHFLVDNRIPTWSKVLAFKALVHPCPTFEAEIIGMHDQSRQQPLQKVAVEGLKWIVGKSARSLLGPYHEEMDWEACTLVLESWELVHQAKHSIEAMRFYNEFKLIESREFYKRATRYEDLAPERVCLFLLCPSPVHIRSRVIGLENFVSKLRPTDADIDSRSQLALLLGEMGGRLHNWLGGRRHWRGSTCFVHVANLLVEAILLYLQALKDWKDSGPCPARKSEPNKLGVCVRALGLARSKSKSKSLDRSCAECQTLSIESIHGLRTVTKYQCHFGAQVLAILCHFLKNRIFEPLSITTTNKSMEDGERKLIFLRVETSVGWLENYRQDQTNWLNKFELRRSSVLLQLLGMLPDEEFASSSMATKLNSYAAGMCPPSIQKAIDAKVIGSQKYTYIKHLMLHVLMINLQYRKH